MTALVILGIVFSVLLFWGVPVSFCIGIATLLALFTVTPDATTALIVSAQRMTSSLDSFTLVAIPLFILAGSMMNTGGIALRLIDFAKVIVGWLPGSLAHISCVANALFGAISGSAIVKIIERNVNDPQAMLAELTAFAQSLKAATKAA